MRTSFKARTEYLRLRGAHGVSATMVAGLPPRARQPLRLDRAAQPARLRRRRDLRGDGARARRRASASTTCRSTASRRRASSTGASAASSSSSASSPGCRSSCDTFDGPGRVVGGGARGGRRRPRRRCCSPTSTTSTTTAARPTFPGHAVVLAGYDDEVAYLSDTAFGELQTTRLENLARARHGEHPIFPLAGHMLTLPAGAELDDPAPRPPRGDRAQRAADDRAGDGRVRGAAGAAALRRRGRRAGPSRSTTGSGARASATR